MSDHASEAEHTEQITERNGRRSIRSFYAVAALFLLFASALPAFAQDSDNDGLPDATDICANDPRNLCAGPVAIDNTTLQAIRLNAGVSTSIECAGTKVDCTGKTWVGDFAYNKSGSISACNLPTGGTSTGESCVITGITTLFGCENEETEDLFQCEHYDTVATTNDQELSYHFNVPNGRYIVNLFFANSRTGTNATGSRLFDIYVEGALKYGAFDQVAAAGGTGKAVIRAVDVAVTDGNGLDILFKHGSMNDPTVKAIEVLTAGCTTNAQCNDNQLCTTDTCVAGACQFAFNTVSCNDGLACTSNDACNAGVCVGANNCPSGQTCSAQSGVCDAASISFNKATLNGDTLNQPTSLDFGPDGKLYVAQQNGAIHRYTVTENPAGTYTVSASEVINLVKNIPNHNDDGTLAPTQTNRLVTGLVAAGTAANPVLYVSSSDPRIGGGLCPAGDPNCVGGVDDRNVDSNSGTVSRLTLNAGTWTKLDLVRGLPRSQENHTGNGMFLDTQSNTLFLAYGGHTNMGAPGNAFVLQPEYALSAAILSINLTAIGNTTYDIPTLDDESTSNVCTAPAAKFGLACTTNSQCNTSAGSGDGKCDGDTKDPFGGNDGKNQAKLVPGGPVQVYSPGYRNPYDVVITQAGRMYTIDNASNASWGDVPINEGPAGNCTNDAHEPGLSHKDNLHFVTGQGFYGGHPNPTRANTNNKFNASNPQSPVTTGNAVECDYRQPGVADGALATFNNSTNGIAEYTASNFSNQMKGNLVTASLNGTVYRIQLNGAGTTATVTSLFANVGNGPLDIYAAGDTDPFPGTIWVADHSDNDVYVFKPTVILSCTGADNSGLDEDGDLFNNADEIDNGTNPCSSADVPPDADGDHLSNLNDLDDDNDTIPDLTDKFAQDAANGTTTSIPLYYGWENDEPPHGGILELGFTGLMTNGTSNYLSLFDTSKMTAGGAAGVLTVDEVAEGDALGNTNAQQYGFQFGVNSAGAVNIFTAHTRLVGPFLGITPTDFQSMGLFIGTGDQDNYLKLVLAANGGAGGVTSLFESGGTAQSGPVDPVALPGPDAVDLYLTINKSASTVQPAYSITTLGVTSAISQLGTAVAIPQAWLTSATSGLAVGLISTSRGAAPVFPASWDFVDIFVGAPNCSTNAQCDDSNSCTNDICNGGVCANTPAADGTSCNDALTCTNPDTCSAGVCRGTDTCPLYQACGAGGSCGVVNGDPDNDGLSGSADPCPGQPRNQCFGGVAVDTTTSKQIRINASTANPTNVECAGAKVDCAGTTWLADFGTAAGGANNVCNLGGGGEGCIITGVTTLFGCEDETTEDIFQCERWDAATLPELQYSYNVPNGTYLVNLYFANTYTGTTTGGSRVFDINIEGATVYNDFDQIAAAGGSGIAVVRSAVVNVSDGNGLQIEFLHVVENPSFKALEVLTLGGPPPPACSTNADCLDTNLCNGTETCNSGVGCVAGTPLACSDGNACNGVETCVAATGCQAGTPPTCNDNNVCNGTETCSPATGCVAGTSLTCDDGNLCNGSETCNSQSGCQAGTPPNCSDADPCTTDSCSANQCQHSGSCPGGSVDVDAASVRSACVGTAGDTITIPAVPVGSQSNRILVVGVGAEEDNADCDLALASATATYGGVAMSKAATKVSNTTSWRACNGLFYLLNPPTGTADVVVSFPTTVTGAIDNRHAGAFVLFGAKQQGPEVVATAGANATTNPVDTSITPLTVGSMIVDVFTQGNTGTFTTTQSGQVEQWEQSCTSSASVASVKPVTATTQTQLGWNRTNPNRYAHSLAAFAPATSAPPVSDAKAFVTITPSGGINASSYNQNSFNVRNDSPSGQTITQIQLDLRGSIYQDLVYDPAGIAGDTATKCLEANTGAVATGFVTPANPCTTPFSSPHDDGYDVITASFSDFNPGETFGFAVDVDPTMIRGTTGQGGDSAGSTSGVEMIGATWTITFSDGSIFTGQPFRIANSQGGSQNIINGVPITAPTIQAVGVSAPATVTTASQTIRVTGTAGASVRLVQVVGTVAFNGGAGFDVDPYEASMATLVSEYAGTIGGGGTLDIPVTLTRTSDIDDLNYFTAAVVSGSGSGQTSNISNVVRLEYVPPSTNVQVDAASIRSACVGTAADTITITGVPVGSQANRVLVVGVGAEEDDADCDLALAQATATYGGVAMSKAVNRVSDTTTWRTCNGIFYLLNPPTGTGNVVVTFPALIANTPIDNRHAGAFVLFNAAQEAPEVTATAGAEATTNPVNTDITPLTVGGVIVDVITQGNTGTFTTNQAGQTEQWEQSCTSSASAGSVKIVTGAAQTTMGWSRTNPNRFSHSLATFKPAAGGSLTFDALDAGSAGSTTTTLPEE